MVNPNEVTKYDRSDYELQEFLLFCISVAGKTAIQIARALDNFLSEADEDVLPFDHIRNLIDQRGLRWAIKRSRLGQWDKLTYVFRYLVENQIDLRTITVEELEKIKWISQKTSRYFILHTRPNQQYAAIDTHIRRFLADRGYTTGSYEELEQVFLRLAKEAGKTPADYDLEIWNESTTRSKAIV